ncbi:hypothetical protein E4U92_35360 [Streptomyces galbus]|uniref:Tetratricopeptide repeat protein n=1 Tax=Streptomyces galbus TaxID=33898 RepID=A0A4U5W3E9_STRGB|nr:hypothetical protein E4U92_35360 [Streptomyces galbus]
MERQQYAQQCSELFAVGGYAAVRKTARAGIEECGPDPVLLRWLGQAHAAEDEDDHDREAEAAYRQGLALAPDDLGLLVSYWELCLRSDSFDHPHRARRAVTMQEKIEQLAPPGSPERRRVDDAVGWAGRGYWDDVTAGAVRGQVEQEVLAEQSVLVTDALRRAARDGVRPDTGEDLRAAELAAAVELLQGSRNAPLRLLLAHRAGAYVVTFLASFSLNKALVWGGVVRFSLWGWLLWIPLLAAEAKLRQAKRLGQQRVIERMQARHEEARDRTPSAG